MINGVFDEFWKITHLSFNALQWHDLHKISNVTCFNQRFCHFTFPFTYFGDNFEYHFGTTTLIRVMSHGILFHQPFRCLFWSSTRLTTTKLSNLSITDPLCRESIGISCTKGQWCEVFPCQNVSCKYVITFSQVSISFNFHIWLLHHLLQIQGWC